MTFCHELARTAVSYSALTAERRLAHGALAGAVEGERRLWHQANAASGLDDAVAEGLESVATRARDRSALCGRGPCVRAGRAHDLRSRPARGAAARCRAERSPGGSRTRGARPSQRGAGVRVRAAAADRAGTRPRPDRGAQRRRRACAGLAHGDRFALRAGRARQGGRDPRRRHPAVAEGRLTGRRGASRTPLHAPRPGRRRSRQARRHAAARDGAALRRRLRRGRRADRPRGRPRPRTAVSRIPTSAPRSPSRAGTRAPARCSDS